MSSLPPTPTDMGILLLSSSAVVTLLAAHSLAPSLECSIQRLRDGTQPCCRALAFSPLWIDTGPWTLHQWPSHIPDSERFSIACQCLSASSCTQLLSTCLLLENSNNHPTDVDLADAQFEAGHVRDEVAERCHARRGSRPSWRSGETTGNQLKYLEPAKELVKHVDQRFAQVRELITIK